MERDAHIGGRDRSLVADIDDEGDLGLGGGRERLVRIETDGERQVEQVDLDGILCVAVDVVERRCGRRRETVVVDRSDRNCSGQRRARRRRVGGDRKLEVEGDRGRIRPWSNELGTRRRRLGEVPGDRKRDIASRDDRQCSSLRHLQAAVEIKAQVRFCEVASLVRDGKCPRRCGSSAGRGGRVEAELDSHVGGQRSVGVVLVVFGRCGVRLTELFLTCPLLGLVLIGANCAPRGGVDVSRKRVGCVGRVAIAVE